jgi:hypothetical protein
MEQLITLLQQASELSDKELVEGEDVPASVKVGDIFVADWGYDQTNIDFYQITQVLKKMVVLRKLEKMVVSSTGHEKTLMPLSGKSVGPDVKKVVKASGNRLYIKINEWITAFPWDGKAQTATGGAFGH